MRIHHAPLKRGRLTQPNAQGRPDQEGLSSALVSGTIAPQATGINAQAKRETPSARAVSSRWLQCRGQHRHRPTNMNTHATLLLVLVLPISAWAEVSDKVPSIGFLLGQAAVFAAIAFVSARYRWWLALVGLAWGLMMLWGSVDLLSDPFLGQALRQEQGDKYFIFAFAGDIAVVLGALAGGVLGWRRQQAALQRLAAQRESAA